MVDRLKNRFNIRVQASSRRGNRWKQYNRNANHRYSASTKRLGWSGGRSVFGRRNTRRGSAWFRNGKKRLWPKDIGRPVQLSLKKKLKVCKTMPLYRSSRVGAKYLARFSRNHFFYTSPGALSADDSYRNSVRRRVGKFVLYYNGVRDFFKSALGLKRVVNFITLRKTSNNFFVTVFERSGKMLFYKSAGMLKLTGPRRSTVEAAEQVMVKVVERLEKEGIKRIGVVLRTRSNKPIRSALRKLDYLYKHGLSTLVISLRQKSHNGIRSKKKKRG